MDLIDNFGLDISNRLVDSIKQLQNLGKKAEETYENMENAALNYISKVNEEDRKANETRFARLEKAHDEYLKKHTAKEMQQAKKELDDKLKQYKDDLDAQTKAYEEFLKKQKDIALKAEDEFQKEKAKIEKKANQYKENSAVLKRNDSFRQVRDTFLLNDKDKDDISKNGGNNIVSGIVKFVEGTVSTLGTALSKLNAEIDRIANAQQKIDTRLQGSNINWQGLNSDIVSAVGASPYVKQADVFQNLQMMIGKGIAYNVEQRAFLETLKVGIADTFDANNSALSKLIRVQQQDSTAARLGMESAMTAFLNNMYETSEYMSDVMQGMKSSLLEAESLMTTAGAVGFEYQVQKWLGSMYSVGVSQSAVNSIGSALGKLAAGQLDGINGGSGNLLVMAAANSGVNIADALRNGLDESDTNTLMRAMVEYLSGIYQETGANRVVMQQYANVFGLSASDLKAIANLNVSDLNNISRSKLSYNDALNRLNYMAGNYGSRMSLGQKMDNAWGNFKYTLSSSIANDPLAYGAFKVGSLLDSTVGGLSFGLPMIMGNGIATEFKVSDILRTAAFGMNILDGIGAISTALGDAFGKTGANGMLNRLGIYGDSAITRGNGSFGLGSIVSGSDVSESGYVGNSSGSDVYQKTMADTTADAKSQVAQAKDESGEEEVTIKNVNENVVLIYELLNSVTNGTAAFSIKSGNEMSWTGLENSAASAMFGTV